MVQDTKIAPYKRSYSNLLFRGKCKEFPPEPSIYKRKLVHSFTPAMCKFTGTIPCFNGTYLSSI